MPAPEGNEYYKLRSKDGRDRIFATPEALIEEANKYFDWCINNPLQELDFRGKDAIAVTIPKMRPFTVEGLCNFLDIAKPTFYEYAKLEGFSNVTTRIKQIIETQQFEGAAAGFLNPNIIARKLGLTDKSEVTVIEEQPLFPE